MIVLACLLAAGGPLSAAVTPTGENSGYVSPYNPINEYLDEIDRIEGEHGPYATELSDMYLGLGQSLLENHEYDQARDAFRRGAMVLRVNYGPNSPEQTNHLYLMANLETAMGEIEMADRLLNTIYSINKKHYGEDSKEMLPVLKRMYEWYQNMRPLRSDVSEFEDYARNVDLTGEIVRVSERVYGENDPAVTTAYRRLGEANFLTVQFLEELKLLPDTARWVAISESTMIPPEAVSISLGEYYSKGRKAFNKYQETLEADDSLTTAERAEALARLGDWYLLVDKYGRSVRFYEEGYQVLAGSPDTAELAGRFMDRPQPMHFVMEPGKGQLKDMPEELPATRLDISMTVTSMGGLRNVEVLNAPDTLSKANIRRIRQQVARTPFRPAMKDGEVVTTRDFIWQYEIIPEGGES